MASLPPALFGIAWLLAVAAGIDAVRRSRGEPSLREHAVWALATVAMLLARQLYVTMPGGVSLQYLGAAWLTLLLGYPRAVTSMLLITLLDGAHHGRPPLALGLDALLFGVAPAWMMWAITRVIRRRLPGNLFVFLIGVGFLGLFVAYALPLLAAALLGAIALVAGGVDPASTHTLLEYGRLALPYALLLAAGEAWLEGMLTTLLVVFAPGSVRLFDEAHYLPRR